MQDDGHKSGHTQNRSTRNQTMGSGLTGLTGFTVGSPQTTESLSSKHAETYLS